MCLTWLAALTLPATALGFRAAGSVSDFGSRGFGKRWKTVGVLKGRG